MPARGKDGRAPAQSLYTGLKLTVMQTASDKPCLVMLATKKREARWDQWDLLFPAIRVPVRELNGYTDVLQAMVDVMQGLIEADRQYK